MRCAMKHNLSCSTSHSTSVVCWLQSSHDKVESHLKQRRHEQSETQTRVWEWLHEWCRGVGRGVSGGGVGDWAVSVGWRVGGANTRRSYPISHRNMSIFVHNSRIRHGSWLNYKRYVCNLTKLCYTWTVKLLNTLQIRSFCVSLPKQKQRFVSFSIFYEMKAINTASLFTLFSHQSECLIKHDNL